jgi:hypothetical protein
MFSNLPKEFNYSNYKDPLFFHNSTIFKSTSFPSALLVHRYESSSFRAVYVERE